MLIAPLPPIEGGGGRPKGGSIPKKFHYISKMLANTTPAMTLAYRLGEARV